MSECLIVLESHGVSNLSDLVGIDPIPSKVAPAFLYIEDRQMLTKIY